MTLPAILPGVIAGALVAFTLSIDEFVIAFFNPGPTSITFPIKVYSMIRFGVTPVINAVAAIVMVVSLLTIVIALRLTRPKGETRRASGSAHEPPHERGKRRVGIKDVAEAAGVSITTVSHALSGKGRLTEETRQRVRRIATDSGTPRTRSPRASRAGAPA